MEAIYEFVRQLWVVWLMAIFIGIVTWAFWPQSRQRFEALGRIPLDDDKPEHR